MGLKYEKLSESIKEQICRDLGLSDEDEAIRRRSGHDTANIWRPCFVRDVEKIIHSLYYNRYTDKTQVFSFYKNDDISRRALHVQLVSRIARNIGKLLGLNTDLIEAIALGHDLGHTPFGHAGERFLNELYNSGTGRYFNHNVHSVRVLDGIFHFNISLQTLDGILCHNGEFECKEYRPRRLTGFEEFDSRMEKCYTQKDFIDTLVPGTLEGCVVRICDMIAYVGKDRQDAVRARIIENEDIFNPSTIGKHNAEIINNLIVNIIENSYGKDYILLDEEHFNALKNIKSENYEKIYKSDALSKKYDECIAPMFERIYKKLMTELEAGKKSSPVFRHHIDVVNKANTYYEGMPYEETEKNQIVTDFIASMTDDYFIDLYEYLFPKEKSMIEYVSYFN